MLSLAEFRKKLRLDNGDYPIEFLWVFDIRASREKIWRYISDTSRLNREMGFGTRNQSEKEGKLLVDTKMLGLKQVWVEEPWTWIYGQTLTSTRNYIQGFAKKMHSIFHVERENENQHRVYIYFSWQPASSFWGLFLKLTASILRDNFAKALHKIESEQIFESDNLFQKPPPELTSSARVSVAEIRRNLESKKLDQKSIDVLINTVISGDDIDVEPLRVIPLARQYKLKQQDLLATCLHATRFGLLKMSWDVICPHCRGSRFSADSIGEIPETANCEACDFEISSSDANAIEVMFHVQPSIRKVETLMYCAAEPAKKSHIKLQQNIAGGLQLRMPLDLPEGQYRARAQGTQIEFTIADGAPATELKIRNGQCENTTIAPDSCLDFENLSEEEVIFVIEEIEWKRAPLQPSHVFALPEFRDLFSAEHLNSSVKLFLGVQTILFTDIVGSTNFYAQFGDAKAFAEVRAHFQKLFSTIEEGNGVVVKTIGDAVMASFQSPEQALRVAIKIQQMFHSDLLESAIRLRVSIHCGPVIAVQLNTGIDYFGNTVNYAAKIQACAGAGEVAISTKVFETYVAEFPQKFAVEVRHNSRDGGSAEDIHILQISNPSKDRKTA